MPSAAPAAGAKTGAPKSSVVRAYLDSLLESDLAPHDRLPTERALAERFSVNRLTVRQVLQRLEQEGRIYRSQGSGTFVAEPHVSKSLELTSFTTDMIGRGLVPGSRLIAAVREPAGAKVGFVLSISPRADVFRLDRLRTGDGRPMCIERTYHPADFFPGLLEQNLEGSIYELLSTSYGVVFDRANQNIAATVLEAAEAELLECAPFSPALKVTRTVQDIRGRHVEYARSLYRGDRYSFDFTVYRSTRT
jgi:GntR family transcriptional regulator